MGNYDLHVILGLESIVTIDTINMINKVLLILILILIVLGIATTTIILDREGLDATILHSNLSDNCYSPKDMSMIIKTVPVALL